MGWPPLVSSFYASSPFYITFQEVAALQRLTTRLKAIIGSSTGVYHDMSVHMDALEKMVRMRGGLQQLGWDGVLQMFISWWVTTRNKLPVLKVTYGG